MTKIQRKPTDTGAAAAQGLDYLLREFRSLTMREPETEDATDFAQFEGPIEPTYLVAAYDTRPAIRALADYVCDGYEDEEEIQAALNEASARNRGLVVLSAGTFVMGTTDYAVTIDIPGDVGMWGLGSDITLLGYYDTFAYDFQITYGDGSSLGRFSIVELSCGIT